MVKGKAEIRRFRPALLGVFVALFVSIALQQQLFAQSTDVSVTIPVGTIAVEGRTSPGAQVNIFENGNDQPAASVISDSNGNFSENLPQDAAGIVAISIQAIDTDGKYTTTITKQVAVISQQTSTLNIILPPTVAVSPETSPFQTGTLEFRGQSVPNGTVTITIEPSTQLTTTAGSDGRYLIPLLVASLPSAGIYSYGIETTIGNELSDYVIAGTFTISPPITQPQLNPPPPLERFVGRITRDPVAIPEIVSPSGSDYEGQKPFVIEGKADPNAEITIYDSGVIQGIVIADDDGVWRFYFAPYKQTHTLYAVACKQGTCSEQSRSISVRRIDSANLLCVPTIRLSEYRIKAFSGASTELKGTLLGEDSGVAVVFWGDSSDERFEYTDSNTLTLGHIYEKAGVYNGYIVVRSGDTCQAAAYFTVEVTDRNRPVPFIITLTSIIAAGLAARWAARRLLVPKA